MGRIKEMMAYLNSTAKDWSSGSAFFSAFDLKKATKITLFEKFCLAFIKKKYQVNEMENNTFVYKVFRGKIYILNHFMHPPKQMKHISNHYK